MEQTLFVHNNMEDECTALMPQLRLSAADYLTIQRYVKCYDKTNATQLHRSLPHDLADSIGIMPRRDILAGMGSMAIVKRRSLSA